MKGKRTLRAAVVTTALAAAGVVRATTPVAVSARRQSEVGTGDVLATPDRCPREWSHSS